ncbi:hypothetical protein GY45DRAFT_1133684 [Cubamyces sp. BRFM 1775]|nr:hypothetical protein GY45DRAFT_1133684 [Cubamyces sp. BRFM 1775]
MKKHVNFGCTPSSTEVALTVSRTITITDTAPFRIGPNILPSSTLHGVPERCVFNNPTPSHTITKPPASVLSTSPTFGDSSTFSIPGVSSFWPSGNSTSSLSGIVSNSSFRRPSPSLSGNVSSSTSETITRPTIKKDHSMTSSSEGSPKSSRPSLIEQRPSSTLTLPTSSTSLPLSTTAGTGRVSVREPQRALSSRYRRVLHLHEILLEALYLPPW